MGQHYYLADDKLTLGSTEEGAWVGHLGRGFPRVVPQKGFWNARSWYEVTIVF